MPATAHSFRFSAIPAPRTRIWGSASRLSGLQRRCNGVLQQVKTRVWGPAGTRYQKGGAA